MNKLFALIVVVLALAATASANVAVTVTCNTTDTFPLIQTFYSAMNRTDACAPLIDPTNSNSVELYGANSFYTWYANDTLCGATEAEAFVAATLATFTDLECTYISYGNTYIPETMSTSMWCSIDGTGPLNMTERDAVFSATQFLVGNLETPCTILSMNANGSNQTGWNMFSLVNTKDNCTYTGFKNAVHAAAANAKEQAGVRSGLYCQPMVFDRPIANYGNQLSCKPWDAIPALTAFENMTECGVVGAFDTSSSQISLYIEPIETPCTAAELKEAVNQAVGDISTCNLHKFDNVDLKHTAVFSVNLDMILNNAQFNAAKAAFIDYAWNTTCAVYGAGSANNYNGKNTAGTGYFTNAVVVSLGCDEAALQAVVAGFNQEYAATIADFKLSLLAFNGQTVYPVGPYDIITKCSGTAEDITVALATANALLSNNCKVVKTFQNADATIGLLPADSAECPQAMFVSQFSAAFDAVYEQNPASFCTLTRYNGQSLIKTTKAVIKLELAMSIQAIPSVPPQVTNILDALLRANNNAPPTQACVVDSYAVDMEKSEMTVYYVNANIVSNKECTAAALQEQVSSWTAGQPVDASVDEYKAPSNTAFSTTASFAVVAAVAAVALLF